MTTMATCYSMTLTSGQGIDPEDTRTWRSGWYAHVVDPEEIHEINDERESGGGSAEEIYAQTFHKSQPVGSRETLTQLLEEHFPGVMILDSATFEHLLDERIQALYHARREEKKAQGWSPYDTSLACVECGGAIYWDHNPEFGHGSNAPWGQLHRQGAHCTQCKIEYTQVSYPDYTQLDGKSPIEPEWTYTFTDGKSYEYTPVKRADYIW